MIKIKFNAEYLFLAAVFGVFLFLGPGVLSDHRINHDFPYGYGSSDSFQHQIRAEAIKDRGNFRYESAYIEKGLNNLVGRYPPVIYHIAVLLSHNAGMETYDSIYFITAFFAVLAAFAFYFAVRDFNKSVAIISLPFSILVFHFPASAGFFWGHWPSIVSQSFLACIFWSSAKINLQKSYLLIGIFLSATALTHTSETIFGIMFIGLFFAVRMITNPNKHDFKYVIFSVVVFAIVSLYYLDIFIHTWAQNQPYTFFVQAVWEGNPGFYIAGFGLLLTFMIIGVFVSALNFRNIHASKIAGFSMLIMGFFNYLGFEVRSFESRFFWPIYLSIFFGLGIYFLLKLIRKNNIVYAISASIIFLIIFSGAFKIPILNQTNVQTIPAIPQLNMNPNQGIMDTYHWESLEWISKNTNENSKIYFFYGDIYSQDALLRNTKRFHAQADPDNFIKAIQERKIKKEYVTEVPGDTGGGVAERISFFHYVDRDSEISGNFSFGPKNICNFDYYVFDKVSRQEVLAQYNLLIAQELVKKESATPVFDNPFVLIMKNNAPGGDCIEERLF